MNKKLLDKEVISLNECGQEYNLTVEPNSSVTILENNLKDGVINLTINENARVIYSSINDEKSSIKRNITINKAAELDYQVISVNDNTDYTHIDITGEHANVAVRNLCVSNGSNQMIDTYIDHKAKDSTSTINNVGFVVNNANVLFNTTGKVENGYSGCDCRQLSKGVVIGDNSKITSRPILLIDEYDVKVYHGASIGKMSDDELFYLMSRGLTKKDAFLLILDGLVSPIISKIPNDKMKEEISEKINEILGE